MNKDLQLIEQGKIRAHLIAFGEHWRPDLFSPKIEEVDQAIMWVIDLINKNEIIQLYL